MLTDPKAEDYLSQVADLGIMCIKNYHLTGEVQNLEEALGYTREAQLIVERNHRYHSAIKAAISRVLLTDSLRIGDQTAFDKAVAGVEEAIAASAFK